MSPTILNFIKSPDLPPQLQWTYAHEPELLAWTIRARNYNTFVANCIFAFMSTITAGGAYIVYSFPTPSEGYSARIIVSLCFYTLISFTISCMTHQRVNFAYRFTKSGVEECEWKNFPKWILPFLKWFTGVTAIIFISLSAVDPTFLIGALVGPGGMGLMYLSMLHSKSYQEMRTSYHHYAFKWEEITQLAIATNREVIDLKYSITMKGNNYKTNWSLNIFCKRKQKDQVAEVIRLYLLPNVPFIRAKVNVPMSTD